MGMTQETASMRILLVEDNPGDARLTKEALKIGRIPCIVDHVVNGEEALAFLRKEGSYTAAMTPHLILLDLNMPRMDGRELLAEMSHDPGLRDIPVVALTTSSAPEDVEACYRNGANAYVVKPAEFTTFLDKMRSLEEFWFGAATLPRSYSA